jgi:hypothetical protein
MAAEQTVARLLLDFDFQQTLASLFDNVCIWREREQLNGVRKRGLDTGKVKRERAGDFCFFLFTRGDIIETVGSDPLVQIH